MVSIIEKLGFEDNFMVVSDFKLCKKFNSNW